MGSAPRWPVAPKDRTPLVSTEIVVTASSLRAFHPLPLRSVSR